MKGVLLLNSEHIVVFFLWIALISCAPEPKPDYLLTQEEMVDVLVEVYLAEARLSSSGIPRDSAEMLFKAYEKTILDRRNIEDSTLRASYKYYFEHSEEMEAILDVVIDSLNIQEQRNRVVP